MKKSTEYSTTNGIDKIFRPVKIIAIALLITLVSVRMQDVSMFETADAANTFPTHAPEFTNQNAQQWFNSKPLVMENLRGKVVLLDFWTYECWNCYRSFPWLKAIEQRLEGEKFIVVGIHTPEFAREHVAANVENKIAEFGLQHPVMMDNDFSYWRAMNNRYWPSFYLLDKNGNVRANFIGETHEGDSQAVKIEKAIRLLLAEPYEPVS